MRKFNHEISNALNAAKINAYLLRRLHGDALDREAADGLDSSLFDAERLVADFDRDSRGPVPPAPASATATSAGATN